MKVQIKCDEHRAELLARELGKIRIWLTGWHAVMILLVGGILGEGLIFAAILGMRRDIEKLRLELLKKINLIGLGD
jgi:hypothetical protein